MNLQEAGMGKKDKTKNKRKTFMSYYWPCLVIVFGPVVIYLVFALIYSLSTQNFFLLSPEFFGTVFLMVLYFFLFKLSYFGFVLMALICSIPLLILLFGAVISARKAKKARSENQD